MCIRDSSKKGGIEKYLLTFVYIETVLNNKESDYFCMSTECLKLLTQIVSTLWVVLTLGSIVIFEDWNVFCLSRFVKLTKLSFNGYKAEHAAQFTFICKLIVNLFLI